MKNRSSLLSDLGQMAQGAASLVDDVRSELKIMSASRTERKQNDQGVVTREDFEALVTRVETLASRIEALEVLNKKPQAPKSSSAKKAANKK